MQCIFYEKISCFLGISQWHSIMKLKKRYVICESCYMGFEERRFYYETETK